MPSISYPTEQLVKKEIWIKRNQNPPASRRQLDATLEKVRTVKKSSTFEGSVAIRQIPYDFAPVDTAVSKKTGKSGQCFDPFSG